MDFVYVPFEELPADADPTAPRGPDCKYTYGTDIFGHSDQWIIADNYSKPTKVYKVPAPVSKMLHHVARSRFEAGRAEAQDRIKRELGIE